MPSDEDEAAARGPASAEQVALANEVFSPGEAEVKQARRLFPATRTKVSRVWAHQVFTAHSVRHVDNSQIASQVFWKRWRRPRRRSDQRCTVESPLPHPTSWTFGSDVCQKGLGAVSLDGKLVDIASIKQAPD